MSGVKQVPELLAMVKGSQALCAFNVETFETLRAAIKAGAETKMPVIVEITVPATERFGLSACRTLCDIYAQEYGADVALHLDHCDDPGAFVAAIDAGFTSGNFLGEAMPWDEYVKHCIALREQLDGRCSFEFVYGELGYAHNHGHDGGVHTNSGRSANIEVDALANFAAQTRPDLFSFDIGSLHGMSSRDRELDLDLLGEVVQSVRLPIVLHGSSGVRHEQVEAAIDLGVRKINIETAIRARNMAAIHSFFEAGQNIGKPRYLSTAIEKSVFDLCVELIQRYTVRAALAGAGR
jgi:fructose/tagatose bisphosphate aldolase